MRGAIQVVGVQIACSLVSIQYTAQRRAECSCFSGCMTEAEWRHIRNVLIFYAAQGNSFWMKGTIC